MKKLAAILVFLVITVPAIAQDEFVNNNVFSAGVSFNADSMGLGVGFYNTSLMKKVGLYVNTALDFTAPIDDIETQDSPWFSWHVPGETKYEHYIFNAGLAFRAAEQIVIYAGGGFAAKQGVTHYFSTASDLNYWVEDSDYEYSGNFNAGLILEIAAGWGIDGGFNSASEGGYVSIAFSF